MDRVASGTGGRAARRRPGRRAIALIAGDRLMLKPEKETLAQVLAKHGNVIACPSCGTYVTMADVDPAAIAAAYNRLELAKLVKA